MKVKPGTEEVNYASVIYKVFTLLFHKMEEIAIATPKELKKEFLEKLRHFITTKNEMTGISSGFKKLDEVTQGFQPSDLVLIGAVPGMGLTSFALSLINNFAIQNNFATGYISLEMSSELLMTRMISTETGISQEKLREGYINDEEIESIDLKTKTLENAKLFIIDYPFLTIDDIRLEAYRLVYGYQIKTLVIDELQLIATSSKDKSGKILNKRELVKITAQLKELAVELNIPIIVLVSLSNRKLWRKNLYRRPLLSNLRRQGGIDQKADLVLFLYRPEYYKIDEWDDEQCSSTVGQAEIIVAKNRNRKLKNIRIKYDGRLGKFEDLYELDSNDNEVPF